MKINFGSVTEWAEQHGRVRRAAADPGPAVGVGPRGSPNLDSIIWARYVSPPDTLSITSVDEAGKPCPMPMYFQTPWNPPSMCDNYTACRHGRRELRAGRRVGPVLLLLGRGHDGHRRHVHAGHGVITE